MTSREPKLTYKEIIQYIESLKNHPKCSVCNMPFQVMPVDAFKLNTNDDLKNADFSTSNLVHWIKALSPIWDWGPDTPERFKKEYYLGVVILVCKDCGEMRFIFADSIRKKLGLWEGNQ